MVDLPLPVGPVTRTSPRDFSVNCLDRLRQAEHLEGQISVGYDAHHRGVGAALAENVHPEPGQTPRTPRERSTWPSRLNSSRCGLVEQAEE